MKFNKMLELLKYRYNIRIDQKDEILEKFIEQSFDTDEEQKTFEKIIEALNESSNLKQHQMNNVLDKVIAYGILNKKL